MIRFNYFLCIIDKEVVIIKVKNSCVKRFRKKKIVFKEHEINIILIIIYYFTIIAL